MASSASASYKPEAGPRGHDATFQEVALNNNDGYDDYAAIYRGLVSPEIGQPQQNVPVRNASLPSGAATLQQRQASQQQLRQQNPAEFPSHPIQQPMMYPMPTTHHIQMPQSMSQNTLDTRPSLDAVADDAASIHSRSPLHTPHQPLRARFDSAQFTSPPAGPKATDFAADRTTPVLKGAVQQLQNEARELPAGYHTPPSFSRASSGWGTANNRKRKTSNNSNGKSTASTPMFSPGIYGPLGGIGSKSSPELQFAEGDYGKSKFARFWLTLLAQNVWIRWTIFIAPVLLLLWIPGICAVTINPTPTVWGVSTLNWSIWLTIVWLGWWGAMLTAMLFPHILKHTIGTVAPEARHYIDYTFALKKTLAAFLWTLALWVSFQPLILAQGPADRSNGAGETLSQITKGLFAIWLCAIILLVEKFIIQVVAYNFHKTSYADRIASSKFAVKTLTTLYLNSRDIGRSDTLDGAGWRDNKEKIDPAKILKKALKGTKRVVTGTTTALGTVASEIIGERVMQSHSPQSMVTSALSSASKSRQLARRIWFSFTPSNRNVMLMQDIAPYFPNEEVLKEVFVMFDKDDNGDVSLEEIEMACLDIHRERKSLSSSMRDLDSAVGRLDQILMSLYYIVAILLIIGLLSVSFSGFLTSASAFVLGLSWLIGSTSQEVLASIVFLLAKHPYDVGDLIMIDGFDTPHVVKEIALLSTVFKRTDGTCVQMPHTILNTKAIINHRRSGATSEVFTWDVDFGTTFEQIEALRQAMLDFLESERRDYVHKCDISVKDFAAQGMLTLSTAIPYKSNWSNNALKVTRRNKWICALKIAMASLNIYGPAGAGNPSPPPADPTVVKLLSAEGFTALPHGPSQSPQSGNAPILRPAVGSTPLASRSNSGPPGPPPLQPVPPVPSMPSAAPTIAEEVNRLDLTSRHAPMEDEQTDVFDYQGDANRQDTLNYGEAVHAAQAQLQGSRTAADSSQTEEGARLNRFRPKDLELGRITRPTPGQQ